MKGWLPQVRQMYEFFVRYDAQMELLRNVDEAMRKDVHPEKLILDVSKKIEKMTQASACFFAMRSGKDFWPIEPLEAGMPEPLPPIPLGLYEGGVVDDLGLRKIVMKKAEGLFPGRTAPQAFLFVPVHSKGDESPLLGILVLESDLEDPYGLPIDPGFLATLAGQLANVFHFFEEFKVHRVMSEILNAFFNSGLKPSDCLKALAKKATSFLPNYGPFQFIEPEVQLLFYDVDCDKGNDDKKKYLTIKATSEEKDWTIERVSVKDSVCGILVENPQMDHYLCDPLSEPRYNWYLGRKEKKIMRTELAVPLRHAGRLIGVLNLETEQKEAFKEIHVEACKNFTRLMESWVYVIKKRMEKDWQRQDATTEAMERFIQSWMDAVAHDVKNDLYRVANPINDAIDIIQLEGKKGISEENTREILDDLYKSKHNSDALKRNINILLTDVRDISKRGCYPIRRFLEDSIFVFKMAHRQDIVMGIIQVDLEGSRDWDVYCSPAMKLHFYEFLQNSHFWIKKKSPTKQAPGNITIHVKELDQDIDKKEEAKKLNTRVQVVFRDNGPGVSLEVLQKLQKLEPGITRRKEEGGSGYGLFAAKEYLSGIKGWVNLDSEEGAFFEVKVILEIFDDELHEIDK